MEVLKGASAAALWGSRAANGVVVIKTKDGYSVDKHQENKHKVTVVLIIVVAGNLRRILLNLRQLKYFGHLPYGYGY